MADRTIYVTIGRNVNGVPMSADRWERYQFDTLTAVRQYARPIYTAANGSGVYLNPSTGESELEDTYVLAAADPDTDGMSHDADRLRGTLRDIARRFGQDAIAFAVAPVEFLG